MGTPSRGGADFAELAHPFPSILSLISVSPALSLFVSL